MINSGVTLGEWLVCAFIAGTFCYYGTIGIIHILNWTVRKTKWKRQ